MKNIGLGLAIVAGFLLSSCASREPKDAADMLIRNARVYTVDKDRPSAQAVAVRGVWIGSDQDSAEYIGASTKVIDAGGRMMLPGFIDSHLHVKIGGGRNVLRITNANSLAEIQKQVGDFSEQHPEMKWIEADGWNYPAFPNGTLPTAADLVEHTV